MIYPPSAQQVKSDFAPFSKPNYGQIRRLRPAALLSRVSESVNGEVGCVIERPYLGTPVQVEAVNA